MAIFKNKKLYSIITILSLLFSLFLTPVLAKTDLNSSYYSKAKIEKLLILYKKLDAFLIKDMNKNIVKLKNVQDKANYKLDFANIKNELENINKEMKYAYDYSFNSYLDRIKVQAQKYKALKKEINSVIETGISPYNIDSTEIQNIENEIILIQKEIVSRLKESLDKYSKSSFKENGKSSFEISSEIGKVTVNIESYTNIYAILTRSQESDLVLNISFDLNVPGTSVYNKETGLYTRTLVNIVGGFKIDANIKIIKNDIYLTLKDYELTFSVASEYKEYEQILNTAQTYLNEFKGKTVHFALPESASSQVNQAEILNKLTQVLDILNENSLLTPFKKVNNIFSLNVKESTLKQISTVFGEDKPNITKNKALLLYTSNGGKIEIYQNINEYDIKGKISLIKENNAYTTTGDFYDPENKDNKASFIIKKDLIKGNFQAEEATVNLNWENNNLSFEASVDGQNITIKGPLSYDNSDLKVNFNSKEIGYIKMVKTGEKTTYDISFNFDIPQELVSGEDMSIKTIKIKLSGETNLETGDFSVKVPDSFIEMEEMNMFKELKSKVIQTDGNPDDFSDL